MTPAFRRFLVPALLVGTAVGVASMFAVPDERPLDELTPEEIARMDDFVARFRLGQRLFGSGRDAKAEQVFRDLLKEEPEAAAVHHALATVLQFVGRADEATRSFLHAAKLAPDDVAIQRDAGLDLLRHGRALDAEPYLGRARAIWPKDVEILTAHAACLRALGRDIAAISAYREALEVQPESVDARVGLGAAIVAEDPQQAFDLMVGMPNGFADAMLVRGLALVGLDRPEKAVPELLTAARRSPRNVGGVAVMGEATRTLGRLGAAQETAVAAAVWCEATGTPPALEPSLLLAEALAALGKPQEALEAADRARAEGAPVPVVRRGRLTAGSLLARMGRADDARTVFALLADEKAESPERALAGFALGRTDLEALDAALGDAPERANDRAWAQAVRAWLEGDDDAAVAHARRSRELSDPPGEFPALLLR